MKRVLILILTTAMTFILFTACQSTPEKPVVVQKDMEQLIEKAVAAPDGQTNKTTSLMEQLNPPERLTEELKSAKGRLKVHVDANIVLPDTDTIPTVHVGKGLFSQEDVTRLYDTLCGDAMPVDPENTQITQAFKAREIQGLLEMKKNGILDSAKYGSMEEQDAAIQQVLREAAGLPEHFERAEPDLSFKPLGSGEQVHLRVAPDDATLSEMFIVNSEDCSKAEYYRDLHEASALSGMTSSGGAPFAFLETESPYFVPPSMNEADARKLADDTIASLGLTDFVCSGRRMNALYSTGVDAEDAPRRGVYEYMYTRVISGVALTYTNDDADSVGSASPPLDYSKKIKDKDGGYHIPDDGTLSYAMPWNYEKIRIIIDDKGVLCLLWDSPYVVTDTVTKATTILPFEDIHNTFQNMITVVDNTYDTSEQDITCEMYITEVRLGLMRVTEKDIGASGLVIPVWDFMGYTEDNVNGVNGKDGYRSLLTINAIDGSIIDRRLGY